MSRSAAAGIVRDPTPEPSGAVTPCPSHEHFADPTPAMLVTEAAIGAAYEEGRALYGEEDGDAWLAALESGVHPLCRVKTAALPS